MSDTLTRDRTIRPRAAAPPRRAALDDSIRPRECDRAHAPAEAGLDVRVWGVRGSLPVSGPETLRYGGDTVGVEVRLPGRALYFDSGSAAPKAGKAMLDDGIKEADLFLSHVHYDHIMGMPFFPPIFRPDVRMRIWYGGAEDADGVRRTITDYFRSPYFPAPFSCTRAEVSFHAFKPGETLDLGDVSVKTAPLHHPDGATGFRAERRIGNADGADEKTASFAYITDFEHDGGAGDESVMRLAENVDLAFMDATYTPEDYKPCAGWGHAHWRACGELADRANAKRWGLFHHRHDRTDDEIDAIVAAARAEFPNAVGVATGNRFLLGGE